jgi:hypothetical protein
VCVLALPRKYFGLYSTEVTTPNRQNSSHQVVVGHPSICVTLHKVFQFPGAQTFDQLNLGYPSRPFIQRLDDVESGLLSQGYQLVVAWQGRLTPNIVDDQRVVVKVAAIARVVVPRLAVAVAQVVDYQRSRMLVEDVLVCRDGYRRCREDYCRGWVRDWC